MEEVVTTSIAAVNITGNIMSDLIDLYKRSGLVSSRAWFESFYCGDCEHFNGDDCEKFKYERPDTTDESTACSSFEDAYEKQD